MKTYLPYHFKKIGIIVVLLGIVLSFVAGINDMEKGFIEGYNSASGIDNPTSYNQESTKTYKQILPQKLVKTLNWVSIVVSFSGFLLYIFSSEKTEDEFIQRLRYQSLEKSLIITWVVALLFFIFRQVEFEAFYVLQIQMIAYVIIFHRYKLKYLTN
jgi:amino acid permease